MTAKGASNKDTEQSVKGSLNNSQTNSNLSTNSPDEVPAWSVAEITLLNKDLFTPEQLELSLWELGAEGVITDALKITSYFPESADIIEERLNSYLNQYGLKAKVSAVPNKNWVQECKDLMEPVECGIFTVRPIPTAEDSVPPRSNLIQIIPGMGFGTGHHEATFGALKLLQSPNINKKNIFKICDVGTGSGILAIGAAKYFAAKIIANDIDDAALSNALENISLNGVSGLIKTTDLKIADLDGPFDLIVANIYAEVLCEMEPTFQDKLSKDGVLILSGIMESAYPLIEKGFSDTKWRFVEKEIKNGWVSLLLRKI